MQGSLEDVSWSDRSILIHGKGDRPREMFFSRAVSTLLDKYLLTRGIVKRFTSCCQCEAGKLSGSKQVGSE
jgi:site-specific recombinase XerD